MFDDKLIADIEDDDFSDFIDLKFNIEGPYSLKYTYEELEPNFKFKNTLPIVKFNICTLINEGISVDDAVFHIGKENKIDPYSLKTELIDEGYIVEGLNVNDLKNKYETYNPKQLKKILKKYKLKRSGSKEELIERLIENIPEDEIPFDSYKLSPKAKKLIQDKEKEYFYDFLYKYVYDEFKEYYPDGDFFTNILDFLEKHRTLAIERKNHFQYIDSCVFKSAIYIDKKDYKKALYWIIARFIAGANYIFLKPEYYPMYTPIDHDSCDFLYTIGKQCTMHEVKITFDKVYEDLNFEYKVPKEICWQIVENVVNDIEIHSILSTLGKYY